MSTEASGLSAEPSGLTTDSGELSTAPSGLTTVSSGLTTDTRARPTYAIEAVDVRRSYAMDGMLIEALRGVTLGIADGEYVAVTGPSGSGKSTLMHLLGALDRPSSGRLLIGGQDTTSLDDAGLARVRGSEIGFVFQSFQLLARTDAQDNVALPLVYRGVSRTERRQRAVAALEAVGLGHRLSHRPTQLSGGEQQRVAIARALVGEPRLVLADEPTGNLDSANGHEVLNVLEQLNRERGVAVVLVTHDADVAARANRLIRMKDGLIVADENQRGREAPRARGPETQREEEPETQRGREPQRRLEEPEAQHEQETERELEETEAPRGSEPEARTRIELQSHAPAQPAEQPHAQISSQAVSPSPFPTSHPTSTPTPTPAPTPAQGSSSEGRDPEVTAALEALELPGIVDTRQSPDAHAAPETPDAHAAPETPGVHGASGTPDVLGAPETRDTHAASETLGVHGASGTPDVLGAPETPDAHAAPEIPDGPGQTR